MEKILISACFLGLNVRYNGEAKTLAHQAISDWQTQGRLIVVCPEVVGGLSVPREPAEMTPNSGRVITQQGVDVSQAFMRGAEHTLHLCQKHQIRFALLKESSPSCGSNTVYDGSFSGTKIVGQGVTAQLLSTNGVKVFSEVNIECLIEELAVSS